MLNTQLILIEGLPGAGKSTTTAHLGTVLQRQRVAYQCFDEEAEPHPIDCLDFALKEMAEKVVPLWQNLVTTTLQAPKVTIIESRLWQNTALFMFMSEYPVAEILDYHQRVWRVLSPLSPVLVYLNQPDTDTALRRLYTLRGEKWIEWALDVTISYPWFQSRGLKDFAGWVSFFEEWQPVAEQLYNDWSYDKIKILNSHEEWARAYQQLDAFLQIDSNLTD